MSVLEDTALHEIAKSGAISPYEPDAVQPASIDLHLGDRFRVVDSHNHRFVDLGAPAPADLTRLVESPPGGFVLHPGEFALGVTLETITVPPWLVGRMEGKSSLGRLGLIVHVTAGFFDPGFSGPGTLEFVNLLNVPIVLRPGVAICQFSFQYLRERPSVLYTGRYQGDTTVGESRYGWESRPAADDPDEPIRGIPGYRERPELGPPDPPASAG